MEPDVLYFFKFSNDTDESEYVDKIHCKDIIAVEAFKPDGVQIKTRYAFRIELKEKVHIFCQEYAIQVNNWVRAIRRAKRSEEELVRTLSHVMTKNVDGLVHSFRQKRGRDVIAYCTTEFDESADAWVTNYKLPFDQFIKVAQASQANFFEVDSLLMKDS